MTLLINTTTPFLRILLSSGDYAQFQAGSLDIGEDDPFYGEVLAEAQRNPSISIMVNSTTCPFCGEVFTGDKAKAKLDAHGKDVHFDIWLKKQEVEAATIIQKEIKARAGYVCDVCAPVQTFGSESDLSEHVVLLHTAPPELDGDGNEIGASKHDDDRRPGEVDPPPAARPSKAASGK
jgi:hypothetical protein